MTRSSRNRDVGGARAAARQPRRASKLSPDASHVSAVLLAGEFLANVVNAIPNPVFVKDEQYRFVFFNDAFCTVMGRERDELLGRTDFDFVPPDEARVFRV